MDPSELRAHKTFDGTAGYLGEALHVQPETGSENDYEGRLRSIELVRQPTTTSKTEQDRCHTSLLEQDEDDLSSTTISDRTVSRLPRIHWKTPVSMVGFLLAGTACAVGHHVYYQSLDHQIVTDSTGIWDLENQQWHLRFGNAFAFVVKSFFVAATIAAFKQYAWTEFGSKAHSVGVIDAAIASAGDLTAYLCFGFLTNTSLLPFIATIAW